MNKFHWPLKSFRRFIPTGDHQGAFGAARKHDRHTGVDLYTPEGSFVYPIMDGKIVAREQFTGAAVGSPWWNDTWALYVYNAELDITTIYGELNRDIAPFNEEFVDASANTPIGAVSRVIKNDKGLPVSMLHVEMYRGLVTTSNWWHDKKPDNLLDPTPYLMQASSRVSRVGDVISAGLITFTAKDTNPMWHGNLFLVQNIKIEEDTEYVHKHIMAKYELYHLANKNSKYSDNIMEVIYVGFGFLRV